MLRSGSTLQYQLAVSILEKTGRGSGLGDPRNVDCLERVNATPPGTMQVLKVHKFKHLRNVEAAIERGQAKCLYTYRDVRDVAVSLMNMRKLSFEELIFRNKEVQQSLDDFKAWTSFDGVLISRYEEMIDNLPQEVYRIAEHLNVELSETEAISIAENHTLDKQKQRIQQWQTSENFNPATHDGKSLLHHNHINSGKPQQWLKTLTPLQIAYLESLTGTWLCDRGYSLSQPSYRRLASQLWYSRYEILRKMERLQHRWQHGT